MPIFPSASSWQPNDIQKMPVGDKALSGSGFKVYVVHIDGGITENQPSFEFCVAGAASLTSVDSLWTEFKSKTAINKAAVELFIDMLRHMGYVQIQ